jgi:hypothetical protein
MATTTRVLDANVNGTVYTTNANAALEAIDTCHSGATAPTDEVANGKLWLDTSTTPGVLKVYNNAAWTLVQSGPNVNVTGAFTSLGIDDNATSTAITIDASENVGIGTAAPSSKLTVFSNGSVPFRWGNTSSLGELTFSGTDPILKSSTGNMLFFSGASESMRVNSNGDLLVGRTSASTATADDGHVFAAVGYNVSNVAGTTSATHTFFQRNGASTVGSITSTSSVVAYNTTSDYRLKENITPIQGAGDIVKAMRPATYTFKADGSWADGFIAHELQELHPIAVTGSKDAMKDEEYEVTPAVEATFDAEGVELTPAVPAVMGTRSVPDYQGVDYSKLTPILTAALQEALNKIDDLTARIEVLEAP